MESNKLILDAIIKALTLGPAPKNYKVNEGNGFIPVKESEIYKKLKNKL